MPENPIQDPAPKNPKAQGPKPDHEQEKIAHPGFTADMRQKPDHGEESYQGVVRHNHVCGWHLCGNALIAMM
jgi:hypothetical protein